MAEKGDEMKFLIFLFLFSQGGEAMADPKGMSISEFFNKATYENMDQVCREFYANDIEFIDPLGEVNGIDNIIKYYKNLYENVVSIKFETVNEFERGEESVFVWQMHLVHKKVGSGAPILVEGVSVFRFENGKAVYHRDYFDLGTMIYEKIPVLGSLIRWIKEKAHAH